MRSNSGAARAIRSLCPCVIGSNVPGYTAMRLSELACAFPIDVTAAACGRHFSTHRCDIRRAGSARRSERRTKSALLAHIKRTVHRSGAALAMQAPARRRRELRIHRSFDIDARTRREPTMLFEQRPGARPEIRIERWIEKDDIEWLCRRSRKQLQRIGTPHLAVVHMQSGEIGDDVFRLLAIAFHHQGMRRAT